MLTTVPTRRLVASILVSDVGIFAEARLRRARRRRRSSRPAPPRGSSAAARLSCSRSLTLVWRRFNQEYKLTVAQAPDGLRLRSRARRADRRDDPAGPRAGGADGRAVPLAAARLVPARGRPRRPAEARRARARRRAGSCARCCPSAAARSRSSCSRASRAGRAAPERLRPPRRGALEEPAALPLPRLGPDGRVRRDDDRPPPAGHGLGAAREGAEPPPRRGPAPAAARARHRPRGHGRPGAARRPPRPRPRRGPRRARRPRRRSRGPPAAPCRRSPLPGWTSGESWFIVGRSGENWTQPRDASRRIRPHHRRQEPAHAAGPFPAAVRGRDRRDPRHGRLPLRLHARGLGRARREPARARSTR